MENRYLTYLFIPWVCEEKMLRHHVHWHVHWGFLGVMRSYSPSNATWADGETQMERPSPFLFATTGFRMSRLPVFLSSFQQTGLVASCCNHEVFLWTSRWPERLEDSNWGWAAGFPLHQSHSLRGGGLHTSMLFITPDKPSLATADKITGHKTIQGRQRINSSKRLVGTNHLVI